MLFKFLNTFNPLYSAPVWDLQLRFVTLQNPEDPQHRKAREESQKLKTEKAAAFLNGNQDSQY